MEKIGHWELEYDEQLYFNENVYLYWVVGDGFNSQYNTKSFCIGYNSETNNMGFVSYVNRSNWNNDIEVVETISDNNYPWINVILFSEVNGGKGDYPEQYKYFVQFMSEINKEEVKKLILRDVIEDIL